MAHGESIKAARQHGNEKGSVTSHLYQYQQQWHHGIIMAISAAGICISSVTGGGESVQYSTTGMLPPTYVCRLCSYVAAANKHHIGARQHQHRRQRKSVIVWHRKRSWRQSKSVSATASKRHGIKALRQRKYGGVTWHHGGGSKHLETVYSGYSPYSVITMLSSSSANEKALCCQRTATRIRIA